MKLRKIYESILNEIGDSIEKPSEGIYIIDSETTGLVKFEWLNDEYGIGIHLPVFQENEGSTRIAIITYFDVIGGTFRLTDKNQPLKLIGFIVGSLVEWMARWKKKFSKNNKVEL